MGKKGRLRRIVVLVAAVLLIASDVGNASVISKLRELGSVAGTASSPQDPPSPSPDPSQVEYSAGKTSNNNRTEKAEGDKSHPPLPPPALPTTPAKDIINQRNKNETWVEAAPGENCTGASTTCSLKHSPMLACILDSQSDVESKALVILVWNKGEGILNVSVSATPNPVDTWHPIPKDQIFKVNLTSGNSSKVILKTETEECELEMKPSVSQGNNFFRFPSTDKLITPVNGAYFLILTVIVFGGSCTCFMLRRRRRQGGIPYQELEMGESSSTNNVVSAEGWDQDWDDAWDEENAVKSPAARHTGSISANGLTSRTPNKEAWENDWDD